jgi:hypothetical protein
MISASGGAVPAESGRDRHAHTHRLTHTHTHKHTHTHTHKRNAPTSPGSRQLFGAPTPPTSPHLALNGCGVLVSPPSPRRASLRPASPLRVKLFRGPPRGGPRSPVRLVVHGRAGPRHADHLALAHNLTLAGLEPAIFGSEDQRLIH